MGKLVNLHREYNILIETRVEELINFDSSEQLLSGKNGPYNDIETWLRGAAHSISLLANYYNEVDKSEKILTAIESFSNAILNSKYYKGEAYFICRNNTNKDKTNGVIGVAWILEGLANGYSVSKSKSTKKCIVEIIQSLKFNDELKLWQRPSLKGQSKEPVDMTFNHQLWLAYSVAFCNKVLGQELNRNVLEFLKNIDKLITVKKDGRIQHAIIKHTVKGYLKKIKTLAKCFIQKKSTKYKEDGYHLFNMYAFARLKSLGYSKYFENAGWFKQALKYANSEELFRSLTTNDEESDYYSLEKSSGLVFNRYGIPYNVSGFEYFYVHNIFGLNNVDLAERYLSNQTKCYVDNNRSKFTEDEVNLYYRLYEYSYNFSIA